ncbi:hypothetical protein LTR74_011426 [Friedmanniomyces endolithicus]|nr:hypothetical protein LTR74_011426 [Friedmanniomyces endolithicus]
MARRQLIQPIFRGSPESSQEQTLDAEESAEDERDRAKVEGREEAMYELYAEVWVETHIRWQSCRRRSMSSFLKARSSCLETAISPEKEWVFGPEVVRWGAMFIIVPCRLPRCVGDSNSARRNGRRTRGPCTAGHEYEDTRLYCSAKRGLYWKAKQIGCPSSWSPPDITGV